MLCIVPVSPCARGRMFTFLSRDNANIAKLQQIRQKLDSEQAFAKTLSSAREAAGLNDRKNPAYIPLKRVKLCPPSEIVGLIERAEVKTVVNEMVAVVEAKFSAEHAAKLAVVTRELVQWVEEALATITQSQLLTREIPRTFKKCGMDFLDDDQELFARHLEKISEHQSTT